MQVPFALQCLDVIEKLHGYNIPVGRRGGGGGRKEGKYSQTVLKVLVLNPKRAYMFIFVLQILVLLCSYLLAFAYPVLLHAAKNKGKGKKRRR